MPEDLRVIAFKSSRMCGSPVHGFFFRTQAGFFKLSNVLQSCRDFYGVQLFDFSGRKMTQKGTNNWAKEKDLHKLQFSRDPSKATSLAHLIPLQQPSLTSILEILNIINGFIYIYTPSMDDQKENVAAEPAKEDSKLAEEALD